MTRSILNLFFLLALGFNAKALPFKSDTLIARYSMFSEYLAPEKLYLHLDRTAYCAGETIWFNGYLKNASSTTIYPESNYIYAELADSDGNIEKRVKVKRDGASFPGHINISEDTGPGKYTVRAYTLAQIDLPPEFLFNQTIVITGGRRSNEPKKDKGGIDVSFYPEGGRFFIGQPSRIGLKVLDPTGRSVETEGRIVNGKGETVSRFSTIHDGMGSFSFIPQEGEEYFCELPSGVRFPVPAASGKGATIAVQKLQDRWKISAYAVSCGTVSILLRDISQLRHLADFEADGNAKSFIIPDDTISEGINHLILTDADGRFISERLFFKYPVNRIRASLSFPGAKNGRRVPVTMRLDLPEGVGADCSVSVLRASLTSCRQDDGIDSYLSLSSELRGKINDPRHYFDPEIPEKKRAADLDLLMMIQGWTYYDMAQIADPKASLGGEKKRHFREYVQQIKGNVSRSLSSKTPEKFLLGFMIPSIGRTSITPVEAGRNFVIDSLDFEEGTGMIIKISRMGKGMDYEPRWDGDEFAGKYRYFPAPGAASTAPGQTKVEFSDPADTLSAAVITAQSGTNLGIAGREMPRMDLKTLSYMSLVDYVKMKAPFQYDGQLMRSQKISLLSTGSEDSWDESPVQLVVNGSLAAWEAFADISLSELKSITISTQPDVLYRAKQGVVAIQLDDGASVSQLGKDDISLVYFTPLGYQAPQQFYSPRYDRGEYNGDPDRRNTILWNPSVKVRNGHAEITFCTTDEESWPYSVQVEGMTDGGVPFSCSGICLGNPL